MSSMTIKVEIEDGKIKYSRQCKEFPVQDYPMVLTMIAEDFAKDRDATDGKMDKA